jgi:hypothetical protein
VLRAIQTYCRTAHIHQKSRSHLKILGARKVRRGDFHNYDSQMLGVTVQNVVVMVTSNPVHAHLWLTISYLFKSCRKSFGRPGGTYGRHSRQFEPAGDSFDTPTTYKLQYISDFRHVHRYTPAMSDLKPVLIA